MSKHTFRCQDKDGQTVYEAMWVTPDRMIALRRSNGDTVILSTRDVSRYVQQLRDLQAEALQGVIWPMNERGNAR